MKTTLLAATVALIFSPALMAATLSTTEAETFTGSSDTVVLDISGNIPVKCVMTFMDLSRSEERRVGKEC